MPGAATLIHCASIAGVSVRFFAVASTGGKPQLPWHSLEDLCAAAKLDRGAREKLRQVANRHADLGLATTPDGTVVQSHTAAIGLIGALIDAGAVPPSFADAYAAAGAEALEALHGGLPAEERFQRLKALARETCGVELVLPQ